MDDDQHPVDPLDDMSDEVLEPLERQPFWTTRRIILAIIIVITLIAFLAYSLQGLFIQPPQPVAPTRLPPML
jgi:fatty acid desaturase